MTTFTGGVFWPIDPRPEEINIQDIAHHLSLICRFTGAVKSFYSVAQHSVLCSRMVSIERDDDARWGLLHDASEAYLADVARPVKPHLYNYRVLESRLARAVAERFGLQFPIPKSVHLADDMLLCGERRDLLPDGPGWEWAKSIPPLRFTIVPWEPDVAEAEFLKRFEELFHGAR
jgi:hypothetical protein